MVKTARKTIAAYLQDGKTPSRPNVPSGLLEKQGVFVTLIKKGELRGCIGQPLPRMSLIGALIDSAISAATRDPRFQPLTHDELPQVEIEVSVMTKPEVLKVEHPKEYPRLIVVGRDGLIVECGVDVGLLLPQVPVEWKWDSEDFLSHTCTKAGLSPNSWFDRKVRVSKFSAQIFGEKGPNGEVEERKLK